MGTRSLSAPKFNLKFSATLKNTLTDETVVSITQPNLNYTAVIANGVEDNQANRSWQFSGTIPVGDIVIFDLYSMNDTDIGAGAGLDALGQDIIFENILGIVIVNDNDVDSSGQLEVYPSSQQGWDAIGSHLAANSGALRGQGLLCKVNPAAAGFDVSAVASHRLTLHAVGDDVDYSIYIMACHDDEESSSSASSESSISSVNSSSSQSASTSSLSSSSASSSLNSSSSKSSSSSQSSSSLSHSV